ncbi:glycoside hydrolase family 16 protein [Punctularia strigosozonata HHB-11173 SS5]|uniref:glycoside hydrolase family 16 protein n=1 Tax=Punctularia strigosozonata (strain HHB-11173) TaxID=741275 RepID=UPI000441745D|nr:glycoside hydrolase family 16 protein [Punctularia strigosozonata HHB-11173 SS5]EIN12881.1 glycoside hydrolase family 16 protein [Punctularia strigosozonata HHB-11173 SS5]
MDGPRPPYASGSSPQTTSYTSLLGSREAETPSGSSSGDQSPSLHQAGVPISLSSLPFRGPAASLSARSSFLSDDSPYSSAKTASLTNSISEKFSLSADPARWGAALYLSSPEPDDYLHNPDPNRDKMNDQGGSVFTARGLSNLGCLLLLILSIVTLFAGYPVISYFTSSTQSTNGGFNLGGTNASGQVPSMPGNWGLIDQDTPTSAYTRTGYHDSSVTYQLVFSDEFNMNGRTFYPGDDPYWEAVDLHYWSTNNLEWYDPAAIMTKDGSLQITLSEKETHGLNYQGGMLATWNKFCFTGGIFEAAVSLPGANNIVGLWPAVWAMGNLGRAGYGATLDGMWPYTYDACDVGTAPNQTINGQPAAALTGGDSGYDGVLSYQPGQRLSRCTCSGESHPGPKHSDGTYVGRSAPEIDVFEAQVSDETGQVSQSCQWAPYNQGYNWFNTTDNFSIANETITALNSYKGGVYQQATSGVTQTNQLCYELVNDCFSVYAFDYQPGFDDAYITWVADDKVAWTLLASGMAADSAVEISARPIPQEPMYLIANLGMSYNFGSIDLDDLTFPTTLKIDYIRVYQREDSINIGCDPSDFPTAAYINQYIEAYSNPNLTTWVDDFGQTIPKNSLVDGCS